MDKRKFKIARSVACATRSRGCCCCLRSSHLVMARPCFDEAAARGDGALSRRRLLKQASRDQRTRQKCLPVSDRCYYVHGRCRAGTHAPRPHQVCAYSSDEPRRCTVRIAPDQFSKLVSADTSYRNPHSPPGPTCQCHSATVSCKSHGSPDDFFFYCFFFSYSKVEFLLLVYIYGVIKKH